MRSAFLCACAVRWAQTKLHVDVSTGRGATPEHARIDLSNAGVLALAWDAEAHAYRALIAHVRRPASRPLGLDVDRFPPYSIIPAVHEQCNTDVNGLRNERVLLAARCMLFNLREDERIAVLYDGLGPSSHCSSPLGLSLDS